MKEYLIVMKDEKKIINPTLEVIKDDRIVRKTLLEFYKYRCFYCKKEVNLSNLQVDHIISQKTKPDEVERLIEIVELPLDFKLDSFYNLVPSDKICNIRKSSTNFPDKTIIFYLAEIKKNYSKIIQLYDRIQKRDNLYELQSIKECLSKRPSSIADVLDVLTDITPTKFQKQKILDIKQQFNISPSFSDFQNQQLLIFFETFHTIADQISTFNLIFSYYPNFFYYYNLGLLINVRKTTNTSLEYRTIIVSKETKNFVRELQDNLLFYPNIPGWYWNHTTYDVINNPLFQNPKKFAQTLGIEYFSELISKNLIFETTNEHFYREYIFNFIDEFSDCLGVENKNEYEINELIEGYLVYFPYWIDMAINFPENSQLVTNMIERNGFIELDMLLPFLGGKKEEIHKKILENIKNEIKLAPNDLKKAIGCDQIPIGLFPKALTLFRNKNIVKVKRIFHPKNLKLVEGKKSYRSWDCFVLDDIIENINIFINEFFKIYEEIINKFFPTLMDKLSIFHKKKYIIQIVEEKKTISNLHDPPYFIQIFEFETEDLPFLQYKIFSKPVIIIKKPHSYRPINNIEYENKKYNCKYWGKNIDFLFDPLSWYNELWKCLSKKLEEVMQNDFNEFKNILHHVQNQMKYIKKSKKIL